MSHRRGPLFWIWQLMFPDGVWKFLVERSASAAPDGVDTSAPDTSIATTMEPSTFAFMRPPRSSPEESIRWLRRDQGGRGEPKLQTYQGESMSALRALRTAAAALTALALL